MVDPNKPIVDARTERGKVYSEPEEGAEQSQPVTAQGEGTGGTEQATVQRSAARSGSVTTVPDQYKTSNYTEIARMLEARMKKQDADMEKMKKRQKIEGIIGGVSDAARAVANLVFTHNYAPNMYDDKRSMSARARTRFEKEKADRKMEDEEWYNNVMRLARLKEIDRQSGLNVWLTEQNLRIKEDAERRAAEIHNHNKQFWGTEQETKEAKRDKAVADADRARTQADNEEALIKAKIASLNRKGVRSGKTSGGKYYLDTPNGREYYDNATMYKAGVEYWTEKLGLTAKDKLETQDGYGVTSTRERTLKTEEKAAQIKTGKKPPAY